MMFFQSLVPTKIILFKLLSLILSSSLPYSFSLSGNFVFDDSEAIVKNRDVISDSWIDPFNNDFWGTSIRSNLSHKSYRPLTILTFRLNYFWNNRVLSAAQFKVTNLLCHVLCCILLWLSYDKIWKKTKSTKKESTLDVPYLAALLFSIHPVHVEAVSGIVGRADILAAITFFLSFLFYNQAMDKAITSSNLVLCIFFAGVSMLFKEHGVTVLGVCCLYDCVLNLKFKRPMHYKKIFKRISTSIIIRLSIIIISIILLLFGRWMIMEGTKPEFKPTDNPAAFTNSLLTKIATYNYIYFLNLVLLIWPQWLCYDWSMGCVSLIKDILDFRILFVLIFYGFGVLTILNIIGDKGNALPKRCLIIAFSLIIIPFLPAMNIFYPVGFVIAERILYIPSAGYCFLISIGLNKIVCRGNCKIIMTMFYLTLLILALRTWQRSFDWQNEYQLFSKGLQVCPLNAKVRYNIAKVADANHHTDWAIEEYKTAISLHPEYYQAMNNLANLLKNENEFKEAEAYLRSAVHYKNDFPAAWMNLGIVLASVKRYDESEQAYKSALLHRSRYPDCYYNLGNLYLEMEKIDEAKKSWLKAISMNSTHVSAWTNLLALLDNTGDVTTALEMIPKALKELPNSASINFSVANIYGKLEKYQEAEQYFLKAIKQFGPTVKPIHYANLGVLYHRWKKYKAAAEMYEFALKLDPNFTSARKNLNNVNKLIR